MNILGTYFTELVSIMNEMAPYLLLGFLFAGILHVYFPKDKVQRYMGGKTFRSVVNGSLFGIPLPLCSCGVIPTGVSFYKNGSSKGSSVSFLISTPQTGADSILVTYSLLGLPFAIIRPVIAFITGIAGGALTNAADKSAVETNNTTNEDSCTVDTTSKNPFTRMIRYAFGEFLQDIQKWLVIGILLAALISVVVPDNFFTETVNSSLLGMIIMLLAAIPLYVCATASVPIAAVLMLKGISPGAVLVFLMAGPATNIATMTVMGNVFGRKTLITYLAAIIGGAFFFGFLVNTLLPREWFLQGLREAHEQTHLLPVWLRVGSTILLTGLIINGFIQKYKHKFRLFSRDANISVNHLNTGTMHTQTIKVNGMTCNHCKANVEKALGKIKGITKANADLATGEVEIEMEKEINAKKIKQAIEDVGYEYGGVKE